MKWFKRKDSVVDLAERYRKQQEKAAEIKKEEQEKSSQDSSSGGMFGFLNNIADAGSSKEGESTSNTTDLSSSESVHERKRKLAKRLSDMTTRLEDISNQIYHLQQRVELIERKVDVNRF